MVSLGYAVHVIYELILSHLHIWYSHQREWSYVSCLNARLRTRRAGRTQKHQATAGLGYGGVWAGMGVYGRVWGCMGGYGRVWVGKAMGAATDKVFEREIAPGTPGPRPSKLSIKPLIYCSRLSH